jgi:carboxyl-terminal processing protease
MTKKHLLKFYPLYLLFLIVFSLGTSQNPREDIYEKINRNMDLFGQVYKEIALNYVDEIDADKFILAGIEGMLSTLDPYTTFIDESSKDQIELITTGKYGGIGITIGFRDSIVMVTEVMTGYEAERKGLRIGDKILEIDNRIPDSKVDGIRGLVRGPVGSNVTLKIDREGEIIIFNLTREEIKLKNVSYYGFIDPVEDGIAYIRLDRFTNISESEFTNAIKTMESQREIKGLVIDLRNNGGGLLDAAIGILNKLVPKNSFLVMTKGKRADSEKKYFSKEEPILSPDVPLTVLINKRSASASEIVAGAIQDLDRGVIVGATSFGKGLVQQVRDLNSKSQLKLTASKYYTPSGRWIQEKDYFKENKYGVFLERDLYEQDQFRTLNGRIVNAHGGIFPDQVINVEGESKLHSTLISKDMFFKYANYYLERNPGISSVSPTNEIFLDFISFLKNQNFNYESAADKKINELREIASEKNYGFEFTNQLDKLKTDIEIEERKEFENAKEEILQSIFQEMNKRLVTESEQIKATFPADKQLQEAVRIIRNRSEYNRLIGKF